MNLPVTFHRAATLSLLRQVYRLGLAFEFMAEIERCVSLASAHPCQYAIVHKDIRRIVANCFPYSVYFRAEEHRIVVLAVFYSRRDPATWQAKT